MSTLGNLIWLLCGGIVAGIGWFLVGVLMIITVIGIPYARACFVIAKFSFCPFGYEIIRRDDLTGHSDLGTSAAGMIGNIIWILLFGWWIALIHVLAAATTAVTIIGIPFAWQHLKLAAISFAPIGKTVVKKELAQLARMSNAQAELNRVRGQWSDAGAPQQSLPAIVQDRQNPQLLSGIPATPPPAALPTHQRYLNPSISSQENSPKARSNLSRFRRIRKNEPLGGSGQN